ncbi:hypothetical protein NIES4074_61860 (plasmid) [Cylindrospermum sp. NIES-4074]|nr:hypothetical protein NIES4074_61860 [Cylindrospermum sp. NIES-4074]
MENSQISTQQKTPNWLKILVICLVVLGIFFRFAHLGEKVYWYDETATSLAISGHTPAEVKQQIMQYEDVISIATLDKYKHINPERGIADTLRYLVTSDPQHPPFYYVMVRLWAQVFGDSHAAIRSLSAIISLLIFPCVYWLCLELFASPVAAWIGMALMAVSPLEVYFAQEARQYGLWMVTILLSSAALLSAMRRETKVSWVVYTFSLALGLYTHLFTVLVAISHGIYVLANQQFRWHKKILNYLISTLVSFLIFLPWIIVLIAHIDTALNLTSWTSLKIANPFDLIGIWLSRISRIFFDINLATDSHVIIDLATESPLSYSLISIITISLMLGFLIVFYTKNNANKISSFISLLGGVFGLSFLLYDLIFGGIRSIHFRYQLPLYLSIQLAVTYVLAYYLVSDKIWQQKLTQLIVSGLIIIGISSDIALFNQNSWWAKISGKNLIEMSQIVQGYKQPLLLVHDDIYNILFTLTLSHSLDAKARLLTIHNNQPLSLPQEYNHIFLLGTDNSLIEKISNDKNYTVKLIYPHEEFWQIEKIPSSNI